MRIVIDLLDYTPETGINHEWVGDYAISVSIGHNEVVIDANRDGLRSLANHFLFLAQEAVPAGSHMHLGPSKSLEEGSLELIIIKAKE